MSNIQKILKEAKKVHQKEFGEFLENTKSELNKIEDEDEKHLAWLKLFKGFIQDLFKMENPYYVDSPKFDRDLEWGNKLHKAIEILDKNIKELEVGTNEKE
jgi:hypothetical protein